MDENLKKKKRKSRKMRKKEREREKERERKKKIYIFFFNPFFLVPLSYFICTLYLPVFFDGVIFFLALGFLLKLHVLSSAFFLFNFLWNDQINYNWFNEPFAVSSYKIDLYLGMHGVIFETSI